jgi:hypothetical protein
VTFLLRGPGAALLACATVTTRSSANPDNLRPVSTGQRVFESLTIVLLALMAFLLALK